MPQTIELADKELEKVDSLVKEGLFSNRESAIKVILESLSLDEIKRVERIKVEVNSFLEIHMGNMLYLDTPVKVVIDGKEMYKFPVKTHADRTRHFFYLYADPHTMEINVNLLTDLRSLPEMPYEELEEIKRVQAEASNYCKNNYSILVAGVPLKDALEVEDGFKECFRIHLIGEYEGKTQICGCLFLDAKTIDVIDRSIYRNND